MNYIQRRIFSSLAVLLCICCPVYAVVVQDGTTSNPTSTISSPYLASMPLSGTSSGLTVSNSGTFSSNSGTVTSNLNSYGFNIVINAGSGLSSNGPALAAFNRAAAQWEARIRNPITVTINADLASLGNGIIGSTGSVQYTAPYNTIRNQLVASAALEGTDDAIVASLPTAAQFTATIPSGFTLSGNLSISKANAKAAGFTGLDAQDGATDAFMTFSSNFNFDYDNSNGVTAGSMDFETVAAHEIGHALGFFSEVDGADQASTGALDPTTLDLFRFALANNPTGAGNFTTTPRDLTPGVAAVTDFGLDTWGLGTDFQMSTGVAKGDGRQASHWKDDVPFGPRSYIGIMDPTLSFGQIETIQDTDLRALDLIGWNIAPIPEPSTYALGATGLAALYWFRRKRAA